jgi:hypothetical protein
MTALASYEASPGLIELGGARPGVVAKMTNTGRVFLLKLRSLRPDDQAIRDLRGLLKKALRQWGFRCISIEEVRDDDQC